MFKDKDIQHITEVKSTTSGTQIKMTKYSKKKEIREMKWKKKIQTTKTDPEMTQIIQLVDKNIKVVIITASHMLKSLKKRIILKTLMIFKKSNLYTLNIQCLNQKYMS